MWHDEPDRRRELRSERDGFMWPGGARSISYVGDFVADSGFDPVPRDEATPARGSEAALLAADPWQKLEAEKRTKTFMIERELPSARRLELSSLSGYAAGWRNCWAARPAVELALGRAREQDAAEGARRNSG